MSTLYPPSGVGRCIPMTVPPRPEYKRVIVTVEIVESERVWEPEAGAYVTRSASAETEVSTLCLYCKTPL